MDKFVNATRLIGVLDEALDKNRLARQDPNLFQHFFVNSCMEYSKQLLENEIAAGGEFRRVVHAHWIDVGGNSICSECRCRSIEDEEGWFCNEKSPMFCPYCGAIMDEPEAE